MKKRIIAVAALLSIAAYILPFVVTKAGSDPVAPNTVPGAPKVLNLRITAYASVPEETDDTPFITANGTFVHDGIIATNLLPFGTQVMIPALFGNKVFVVADRMAPYFKKSVDIWMPSVGKALYFGVHYAQVVVIPAGPTLTISVPTNAAATSVATAFAATLASSLK
jgi:3D (Asp-Asp-Asp) domain-containing protein